MQHFRLLMCLLPLIIFIIIKVSHVTGILLYPASSVLQITASVTAPIEDPVNRLFFDWGFQMNYNFPYTLTEFYNVRIWANIFNDRKIRDLNAALNENMTTISNKWQDNLHKYDFDRSEARHPSDFTAAELYQSFENSLMRYGIHETCLLRAVCELAGHPFADDQENILTEIITFVLTPSLHGAFAEKETLYREVYEEAENFGFLGRNCSQLYFECKYDLLSGLSKIMYEDI